MGHDSLMANHWHDLIGEDDRVLHLGDLMVWWGGQEQEEAKQIVRALPGRIQMIRGNHDKFTDEQFCNLGIEIVPEFTQIFSGLRIHFSHKRALPDPKLWDFNIHGHVHNNTHREGGKEQAPTNKHINISIEVMDYKPVRLGDIINGLV